jgi:hypothetical protein
LFGRNVGNMIASFAASMPDRLLADRPDEQAWA